MPDNRDESVLVEEMALEGKDDIVGLSMFFHNLLFEIWEKIHVDLAIGIRNHNIRIELAWRTKVN